MLLALQGGCVDPNEMFSGRWESRLEPYSGLLEGAPVLALGHFGLEVAGVAYFKQQQPDGALYVEACPCSFIEHQDVDLEDARLAFSTSCGGPAQTLDWDLERVEEGSEVVLQGALRAATGGGEAIGVELVLADEFLSEAERECPPPGL